ncbi:Cys-tRNA(Pro) deacylase [Gryllotalpicola sp.]|uniref:Cys-tRNA(Pro) deacylase n=1 Tax=Gryllotalpicola sp. TaxID=1932787 RepID=UPI002625EDBF|nr:Cys-tRNA(Pro) deacylase [Gryllotalpicola sp.]
MAKKSGAAPTLAIVALARAGVAFAVRGYEHDPAASDFGAEAARVLGVEPGRVFKTLMASTDVGFVLGIVPVDAMLDLKALAAAVGGKRATMADPRDAERKSGYIVGGISPIGQKTALPTVLDDSALEHETILVSGGRRGVDIELSPADLVRVTAAITSPLRR